MRRGDSSIDALPERTAYRDTGCKEVAPSCLTCPLPRCRYDEPSLNVPVARARARAAEMRSAQQQQRLPISELAQRFGVSTRTIHRALRGPAALGSEVP